ncbi:MAG: CDP-diacylglycerol--glycerol-3-phosphate 3-phosphatidyltransferase, partial [uncultured Nocardioidaceae bacterium]
EHRRGHSSAEPGPDGPQRPQHHEALPPAGVPLAGARPRGRRHSDGGPDVHGHQRLLRRLRRPPLEPDLEARRDPRPRRGPALHPRRRDRLRAPRHHPALARARDPGPRPVPVVPGAVPAHPRLQRPSRPLPRQGGHGGAPLRLPAAAARGRDRTARRGVAGPRVGVHHLGGGDVLVGRRPLRLAGPDPHRDHPTPDTGDPWL